MMCIGLPTVKVTPSSQTLEVTCNLRLNTSVDGVGSENFFYQWYHNRTIIKGENREYLSINNVTESDGGYYECVVTNYYGDKSISNAAIIYITSK